MRRKITITATRCTCDHCGHSWTSLGDKQTAVCAKCRRRTWDGGKLRHHGKEIKLPKPRKGGRPRAISMHDGDAEP